MDSSQFDATSEPSPSQSPQRKGRAAAFVGIQFKCCRTYGRIYRNREQNAYLGRCPKCGCPVNIGIQPGGVSSRFFSAG